jgi:hypothetical protein
MHKILSINTILDLHFTPRPLFNDLEQIVFFPAKPENEEEKKLLPTKASQLQ